MTEREIRPTCGHRIATALAAIEARPVQSAEDDRAAFARLATLGGSGVYVGRFSGATPWERHPDDDELLHVLEGKTEVTFLDAEGSRSVLLEAGDVVVVPRAVWHMQVAMPSVALLAVTPERSDVSDAADPRAATGAGGR